MLNQDSALYDDFSQEINHEQCYEEENREQFEDIEEPKNDNSLFNQSSLNMNLTQTTKKQKIVKYNYKNVPKQIGNNLCKYAIRNYSDNMPPGLNKLIETRGREKKLQSKTTIAQLRKTCQTDEKSKKIFKKYIKKQFFVDLIQSNKISDPLSFILAISNYCACAEEPEKMIGSQLIMKKDR